jgi:hypothetical protein
VVETSGAAVGVIVHTGLVEVERGSATTTTQSSNLHQISHLCTFISRCFDLRSSFESTLWKYRASPLCGNIAWYKSDFIIICQITLTVLNGNKFCSCS